MALPGDSITITPGAGATVATETVNAKEYQAMMVASANGHLLKTLDTYSYWSGINVGAQNKIHLDLFNAAAASKLVRIRALYLQCATSDVDNAVTYEFDVNKTSAVGTGGSVLTGRLWDSSNTAIHASVTARHGATAGATVSFVYFPILIDALNTNQPGASMASRVNHLPQGHYFQDLILRADEGLSVSQITNNAVATWSVHLIVTME
jgi:hypothetical protein